MNMNIDNERESKMERKIEVEKLVEVTRGDLVESVHRGAAAVVDRTGKIIASVGDPRYLTYIRSAGKPIQALPVVESGAAAHYNLSLREIAIMTGSHSGQPEHGETTIGILKKIGLGPEYLQCGVHPPLHGPSKRALLAEGSKPTELHSTCSGKHAGMLTLGQYRKLTLEGYYLSEHPIQQEMLRAVADMTGLVPEEIPLGIDGCGVPVFGMTLEKMAYAYARLAAPSDLPEEKKEACEVVKKAMTAHPLMVAGTGRFTTDLIKAAGERLIAKDGAESVYCIGVPEKGWGIALKVEDGSGRALGPAVISILDQLGLLKADEKETLAVHGRRKIKNYRKEIIGEIRPAVELNMREC